MPEARLISPNSIVRRRVLEDVSGRAVRLPQEGALVHLQFRRFAGCPVCNLHLRSFARRHGELEAAGVREIVLFHSPADELRLHTADFPFTIVADPDKRLYAEFGVTSSPRALLDPRAWLPILRAVAFAIGGLLTGTVRPPPAKPHGGRLGLPADFLIAPDGRMIASKYGEHVDDHWSVDDVLARARQHISAWPV
ncbi:MAG: AhpC/TSA family protein [Reyranella sp.]|nr:AhpC/TSA family protein [Reyranella sp.]